MFFFNLLLACLVRRLVERTQSNHAEHSIENMAH